MTTTFTYELIGNMALPGAGDNAACRQLISDGFKALEQVADLKFVEKPGGSVKVSAGDPGGGVWSRWFVSQNHIVFSRSRTWANPNSLRGTATHEMEHVVLGDRTEWTHKRDGETKEQAIARTHAAIRARYGPSPTPAPLPPPLPPNPDPPDGPGFHLPANFIKADDFAWGPGGREGGRVLPVRNTGAVYIHSADSFIQKNVPYKNILIVACGQPYPPNSWPQMEIHLDNAPVRTIPVVTSEYKAYRVELPKPGLLRIGMVSDASGGPRNDKNLIVYGVGWGATDPDPPEPEPPVQHEATVEFLQGSQFRALVRLKDGREFGAVLTQI